MAAQYTRYEPQPRGGNVAFAMDNELYIWGGFPWTGSKEELAKVVEVLDFTTELWEQKPTHGTIPPALWHPVYTVMGSCLFVLGEKDLGSHHWNSFFKLDLKTFQWEEVQVSNPSSGPQEEIPCGMVSYGDNQLVVIAGHLVHIFNLDKGK